jgi:hypothetical protein
LVGAVLGVGPEKAEPMAPTIALTSEMIAQAISKTAEMATMRRRR